MCERERERERERVGEYIGINRVVWVTCSWMSWGVRESGGGRVSMVGGNKWMCVWVCGCVGVCVCVCEREREIT